MILNSERRNMSKYKNFKNSEKGLGLIEVIAALALAVVVITSLVSLSVFTLRSSTRGKLLLQSTKIANTQVELIRAFRDSYTNWGEFIDQIDGGSGTPDCVGGTCHIDVSANTLNVSSGSGTTGTGADAISYSFQLSDPINNDGVVNTDEIVRVDVLVSYTLGSQSKETRITTDISNWRSE